MLSSRIRVYSIRHSQSDQGLHRLPFSAVWSGSNLLAILSSLIKVKVYTVIYRNSLTPWSTLYAILSSLIRVDTICHSQYSDQGLHYLPFSTVWSGSTPFAITSSLIKVCNEVWSGSTIYAIPSSLIKFKIHCHSQQQSEHGLHYLPFSAVWSESTLLAILISLIRVYTVCHS